MLATYVIIIIPFVIMWSLYGYMLFKFIKNLWLIVLIHILFTMIVALVMMFKLHKNNKQFSRSKYFILLQIFSIPSSSCEVSAGFSKLFCMCDICHQDFLRLLLKGWLWQKSMASRTPLVVHNENVPNYRGIHGSWCLQNWILAAHVHVYFKQLCLPL